ncbi:aurora kinase C-like [Dermatophagoides farinae]|uniref:aurora kinase C-like n=1 Tax=Dermatophagoides farinae TaxID=6954 RepID=UPI003F5E60AC
MISAIRACHKMNVIHRDLKPENILIDLDGRLKLADFGWAAHIPEEPDRRKTYCGTMDYLSPEIVRQEWYGKEVDIWCLGILCFELATGGPPFKYDVPEEIPCEEEKARRKQQYEIQYGDLEPKLLPFMSAEICDFLRHTLEKNPDLRMTPDEMLRHPFITKYNAREIENELYADTKFPDFPREARYEFSKEPISMLKNAHVHYVLKIGDFSQSEIAFVENDYLREP